jgi:hypothetical protein
MNARARVLEAKAVGAERIPRALAQNFVNLFALMEKL